MSPATCFSYSVPLPLRRPDPCMAKAVLRTRPLGHCCHATLGRDEPPSVALSALVRMSAPLDRHRPAPHITEAADPTALRARRPSPALNDIEGGSIHHARAGAAHPRRRLQPFPTAHRPFFVAARTFSATSVPSAMCITGSQGLSRTVPARWRRTGFHSVRLGCAPVKGLTVGEAKYPQITTSYESWSGQQSGEASSWFSEGLEGSRRLK
ncbi:hypothetical protein C8J57DRAFT_363751 [Mycena rebaudengoi]|nr:hypothetical protein C8J57DRAFT_363751 [Mycena rebaudengoi]